MLVPVWFEQEKMVTPMAGKVHAGRYPTICPGEHRPV